jgi:hypothetical protein
VANIAPKVQGSFPGATITVYNAGTLTLSTIYADNTGTVKANPFTAASDGTWFFYAPNGTYDVKFSGGGLAAPFTIGDLVSDASGVISYTTALLPVSTALTAGNLARVTDGAGGLWMNSGANWSKVFPPLNIKDAPYNAKGDGVADDTAAIQAAFNAASILAASGPPRAIFVPEGKFRFSSITIPTGVVGYSGIHFYGTGEGSKLIQFGTGIAFASNLAGNVHMPMTISDLWFDCTLGTGYCIDTSYTAGTGLRNLFFNDVPNGFACIKVDGNVTANVYTHDNRLNNIRIYVPPGSSNHGQSGIFLGATCADSEITNFIMEGRLLCDYCLYFKGGCQTVAVSNSHPYNGKINVMKMFAGGNHSFTNVRFDFGQQDTIYMQGIFSTSFVNCALQGINTGYSAITLDNCFSNDFTNTTFFRNGTTGQISLIKEINGTTDTSVNMVLVDNLTFYSTPFDLSGARSYVKSVKGYSNYGAIYSLAGAGSSAQAQNVTRYYGANGPQTTSGFAQWPIPMDGKFMFGYVACDTTPASGQTFTVRIYYNLGTLLGTLVINNGSFGGQITPSLPLPDVFATAPIWFQIDSSATSGSATFRVSVTLLG